MWCDFWNHWVQLKCRLSHQLTHINMFFIFSVPSVVLFLLSAQNPARQQSHQGACVSVCSHFYESLCVYVQLPDPRSPVRLLWILRVLDFWSGFFQGGCTGIYITRVPVAAAWLCVGVRQASQGESVSALRLLLCHHLRWMEGGATSARLLIKRRLMRQSQGWDVQVCEHVREGGEDDNTQTHSSCASFCQEMGCQTLRVTRTLF